MLIAETLLYYAKSKIPGLDNIFPFAEIDRDLFFLLQEIPNQLWFEHLLLENYFPNAKYNYLRPETNYEEEKIENEILNEPREEYQNHIDRLRETLPEDELEEEIW